MQALLFTLRNPAHNVEAECRVKGGMRMECNREYLIERILDHRCDHIPYTGCIRMNCMPDFLCPPLRLETIDVIDIVQVGYTKSTVHKCAGSLIQRLRLCVRCWVMDKNGNRDQFLSSLEVCIKGAGDVRGTRLGVQIRLMHSCYYGAGRFDIQADICVHTVVICCERFEAEKRHRQMLPPQPLYPQPIHSTHQWKCVRG